jgi:predicted N-acyltransferase
VREAGITFRRLVGREIDAEHWKFFNRCYRTTYRAHHSTPYLSLDFFKAIGATLPDNVLMVLGERAGKPIAAVLNLFDARCLYGRYWGTTEYHSGLHFEACYYQALEFCIERGIAVFEGGAQGEHKLARGFTPVETRSAHWLKHPRFASAIEQFLAKEGKGIERYIDELNDHSPFKAGEG